MPRQNKKIVKVIVAGANGRMGRELTRLLSRDRRFKLVGQVDNSSQWSQFSGEDVDVVIEFSTPPGLRDALDWCSRYRVPLVSGTTGLSAADKRRVSRAAKKIPLLYSANMSLGIAVMKAMVSNMAAIKSWRFTLDEVHHLKKKDKPSGTAKMLAGYLLAEAGPVRLKIVSHRRGRVPGIHQIAADGSDETLVVRHIAHHRRIFARGAIEGAGWLFDKKKPGLYDISDLYKGQ